jgi:hypothetical protein
MVGRDERMTKLSPSGRRCHIVLSAAFAEVQAALA